MKWFWSLTCVLPSRWRKRFYHHTCPHDTKVRACRATKHFSMPWKSERNASVDVGRVESLMSHPSFSWPATALWSSVCSKKKKKCSCCICSHASILRLGHWSPPNVSTWGHGFCFTDASLWCLYLDQNLLRAQQTMCSVPVVLGKPTPGWQHCLVPVCVVQARCSSVATSSCQQWPRMNSGWIQSLSANCRGCARGAGRAVTQIYAQKWACNVGGQGDSNMCVVEGKEPLSLLIRVELDHGLMLFSKGQELGREAAAEYSNKWLVSEECPAVSMEQLCHFSANPLRTIRKEDKMSAALLGLPLRV